MIMAFAIIFHCCKFGWFLSGFFFFVHQHIKYFLFTIFRNQFTTESPCLVSWANKLCLQTCAQPLKTSTVSWCTVGPYAGSHNRHCTFALRASPSEVMQKSGVTPAMVGSGERKKKAMQFFCQIDHWDLDSQFPNKLSACCKKRKCEVQLSYVVNCSFSPARATKTPFQELKMFWAAQHPSHSVIRL